MNGNNLPEWAPKGPCAEGSDFFQIAYRGAKAAREILTGFRAPGEDNMTAHGQVIPEQQPEQRVSEAAKLAKRLAIKWMPKTPTVLRINCQAAILEHHYASQPASATPQQPQKEQQRQSSPSAEKLLSELDGYYARYRQVEHQAIWGGSYERESGARMELKPLVNTMFDTLLKLLESRKEPK